MSLPLLRWNEAVVRRLVRIIKNLLLMLLLSTTTTRQNSAAPCHSLNRQQRLAHQHQLRQNALILHTVLLSVQPLMTLDLSQNVKTVSKKQLILFSGMDG